MDSIGAGDKLAARTAKNYPAFWQIIEQNNQKYLHQLVRPSFFANITRPRNDACWFMWRGIPSITFKSFGGSEAYHTPADNLSIINPEILEEMSRLLFLTTVDITTKDKINLKASAPRPLFIPLDL